jgi:protein SCO1/2
MTKYLLILLSIFLSCTAKQDKLPYLGHKRIENGKEIYHKIRPYSFLNQDSTIITNDSLKNVVYIADFFFVSCPSICPKVAKQMLKLHDEFKTNNKVRLVSFTIDPKRDTVGRLKEYANNLEVKSDKWLFLTGDKYFTLDLANDFFVAALEDPSAPGGFDHSGKIILVDKSGHVRSFCEGTEPETLPKFIEDVKTLLKEYEQ